MHTITRRTALAASVSLPLLPVASYATPVDPVIPAYRAWCDSLTALEENVKERVEDEAAYYRQWASRLALSDTVATTPAGLALQIRFTFSLWGEVDRDGKSSTSMPITSTTGPRITKGAFCAPCLPVPREWRTPENL